MRATTGRAISGKAQTALRLVRRIVDTAEYGRRLPSARALARRLGCSEITVRRALKELKRDGKISTVVGDGTYAGATPPKPPRQAAASRANSSETLADQIQALVARGVLRTGEMLPVLKSLSIQFHVTLRTVGNAYAVLASRGFATRVGRKYYVGKFGDIARMRHRGEVLFLNCSPTWGFEDLYHSNHGPSLTYRALETELLRHSCSFRYDHADALQNHLQSWRRDGRLPAAMVLAEPTPQAYEAILNQTQPMLRPHGRSSTPVAVVSYATGRPPSNVHLACYGNIDTVRMRRLAEALAERSLTSVAVFVDEHSGGNAAFAATSKLRPEFLHLAPNARFHFAVIPWPRTGARPFLDRMLEAYGRARLEAIYGKYAPTPFSRIAAETTEYGSLEAAFLARPARESAVWVFTDDRDAEAGYLWLNDRGVRVPQDVAIVTLQNDPAFLDHGLSACVPDYISLGYLLAHAILGDIPVERTSHGYVRPSAVFLERTTTMPPRIRGPGR